MIFGYLLVKSFSQQFFHEKVFPPHTTSKLDRFFFLVRISIVSIAFLKLDICVPAAVLVDSAVCYWFLALTGIPIYLV
jgi:hypothetical protein